MKTTFIINGEAPAKKNNRRTLANGQTIPSAGHVAWHDAAMFQFRHDYPDFLHKPPINQPVRIRLSFYHNTKQRRDSDNQATSILDLLKDLAVIKDDCWQIVRELEILNYYDRQHPPFCGVEISPLNNIIK